jgi:predicted nicotinamide N-methyase
VKQDPQTEVLLSRLQGLCPMRTLKLRLGRFDLQPFWTAVSSDPLLEQLAAKADDHPDVVDERMPYWAELWPSARGLAEAILSADKLPGGPWLELGCGPGLAGLAARLRGVPGTWTDYADEALWLSELNARSHGIADPHCRLLDWRQPPQDVKVPWLLASDVAYETRFFEPLLACMDQLLLPGGELWLGEPGRPVARAFFNGLMQNGWQSGELLCLGDVRIYRLTRKSDG